MSIKEKEIYPKDKERQQKGFSSFSVIVVFLCLLLIGLTFIPQLPLKLNPSRKMPVVNISFSMPGHSARVIEMEVTSKLEAMLSRIKGVKDINSYSANGYGYLTIWLSEYVEPEIARFEISTVVRQTWSSMPGGVSYPYIYMSGTSEETSYPFLSYTVNAPYPPSTIQKYIEENLKNKISQIEGIDEVNISGATPLIYRLEYDFVHLQNYGMTVEDIKSVLEGYFTREFLGMGRIDDEENHSSWIRLVATTGEYGEEFDASNIQVKNIDGTIVYLSQLVKVSLEEQEPTSFFRINGLNSVYLSVKAKEEANQLKLSKQVQLLLENLKYSFPQGYELHLSYDAGEYIQAEMQKIYFRSGLTILILLCFVLLVYRNLKYSFIILFSLIANILIAVIFYYLLRLEIQLYSLAGITISLTLIIDNTIVMSDQIIHRGNRKAFLAILTATVTTMGALVIIFFMDESVQLNLRDFAWVIIINLIVSLFIALFLVPALIDKLHLVVKKRKPKVLNKSRFLYISTRKKKKIFIRFNRLYEIIIRFMYRRRKWFVAGVILLFGLPVFLLPAKIETQEDKEEEAEQVDFWKNLYNHTLGTEVYNERVKPIVNVALGGTMRLFAEKVREGSYSSGDRSETTLLVTASLPNGATRKQMDGLVGKMENYINLYDGVRQFETYVQSGQRASIRIFFTKENQRSSFPYVLKQRLIEQAILLGGGSWSVQGLGDGFSNEMRENAGAYRIKLLGYNYDELTSLAEAMKDSLLRHPRIKEVTIDSEFSWYKNDYMEYVFNLDKQRLAQEDIQPLELYYALTPMFEKQLSAGNWMSKEGIHPIYLYSKQVDEMDIWNLENFPAKVGAKEFKLSDISIIEKSQIPQNIAKENQQYRLCLQYEYIGGYEYAKSVAEQQVKLFNANAPLGYKAERDSSGYWWEQSSKNQYGLLLIIILIIFFTTSILFNSLRQPFVVIFSIPISFIGLFLTFYWFELDFDQGGFAAFILLAGLSVNANIYILNEYNNIRNIYPDILPVRAYIKAWNAKIRPVFLTVVSTVLGFIPFMIGEYREAFWFPLAAGASGGIIMSLIALFFFLPLFMGVGKKQ